MSRIHTLDDHLTNMIAAGEVVERPMGVVKELVENALDAGASQVIVKVANGGRDAIQVIDDGCGMDQQDASLAFMRHATSKISRPDDLWQIHTMGFRGEALPSIAAVSKVHLLTSDGTDSTGIDLEYGKVVKAGPAAARKGTDITVEGLFYKTPARLKHLRSASAETAAIVELMQKYALSHPEVAFELFSDDKRRLQTPGSGSLEEAMLNVYGLEITQASLPVAFSDFDFQVSGRIVLPSITRSTKQYISCFVNGRIVHSYALQKAVIDAYHEFMMPDRFPVCVLNVQADYQLVDVNVHPAKWEIRLSKERQLTDLVQRKIRETLLENYRPGKIDLAPRQPRYASQQPLFTEADPAPAETVLQDAPEACQPPQPAEYQPLSGREVALERFRYLAQLHGSYILACDDENLYIVDQHAAMERCRYEEISDQIARRQVAMQVLLVPLVVELTPAQLAQLDKINAVLAVIGMKLEPFSPTSAVAREVPLWFDQLDDQQFLKDLIDAILEEKKSTSAEIMKDRIATMACHSSVRFNHHLDESESRQLLARLGRCRQPFNCPHGRPTMMVISDAQLEKEFKRVL
jgi:DNA mismatch repair protein MutL